jgi:hypothetical protein
MMKLIPWMQQRWGVLLWGLIALATLLKLAAALNTHIIHTDTHLYLSIASNYQLTGKLTPAMWRMNDFDILAGSGTGYMIYPFVWVLQAAGISILSVQLLNYAVGLVGLGLIYAAAREWFDLDAALVTVAFAACSSMFFSQYHGRMDAFGAAAYSAVLWAFACGQKRNGWGWHALVGAGVIVAAEFHIIATVYVVVFAAYYAVSYLGALRQARHWIWHWPSIAFFGAAFLAGLIYIAVHVLPDPQTYFAISQAVNLGSTRWASLLYAAYHFATVFPFETITLLPLLLWVGLRSGYRPLAILWAGWLIGYGVIFPGYWPHYSAHVWPLLALTVGSVWMTEIKRPQAKRLRPALIALLVVMVTFNGLRHFVLPTEWPMMNYAEHQSSIAYLRAHFPLETPIATSLKFYLFAWMPDYVNMMTTGDYEIVGINLRGETYTDYWAREQPQVYYGTLEAIAGPTEFLAYLEAQQFVEVYPNIWVQPAFAQSLGLLP